MDKTAFGIGLCLIFFAVLVLITWTGFWLAQWQRRRKKELAESNSVVTVLSALFALLGLLIAFSFSGAFSRFDNRRQIIVDEVNSLSTAYARLDVLAEDSQAQLKPLFKAYADSRAKLYDLIVDEPEAWRELGRAEQLQGQLWALLIEATRGDNSSARMLLLPAFNDMFDIATKRTVAIQTHPPKLIYIAIAVVGLSCAGFLGYSVSVAKRQTLSLVHVVGFAAVIAFVFYVILDVEFARFGFVTLATVNQLLLDFANSI